MIRSPDSRNVRKADFNEFSAFLLAFLNLYNAGRGAEYRSLLPWENPVAWNVLRETGVNEFDLCWLLFQGHIAHYKPIAKPTESIHIDDTSCFAATAAGMCFIERFLGCVIAPEPGADVDDAYEMLLLEPLPPRFDQQERMLLWGQHLVKCFRAPATNQELVVKSAEEMGWPDWFDDPLPRELGINPKQRLHDTIKDLNRRQKSAWLHFKGDGTGTRVGWEFR